MNSTSLHAIENVLRSNRHYLSLMGFDAAAKHVMEAIVALECAFEESDCLPQPVSGLSQCVLELNEVLRFLCLNDKDRPANEIAIAVSLLY
ncbi:MAG: hypothetical protein CFE32_14890 [Alphaproteobacteria bacterium PA3]|nr:MAG: hypothetical protein CFE32_14890 [Alphaproteobacteria bacterium PA3]